MSSTPIPNTHGVVVIHLPFNSVCIVATQKAGICILLIIFKFVIFIATATELIRINQFLI